MGLTLRGDAGRRGGPLPIALAILALGSIGPLLAWDAWPRAFPDRAHELLGALPLGLAALAWLAYRLDRRPGRWELFKAAILIAAFLSWAANQLWPELAQATLLNDVAIALFVLDVVLGITGWAPGPRAERVVRSDADRPDREAGLGV